MSLSPTSVAFPETDGPPVPLGSSPARPASYLPFRRISLPTAPSLVHRQSIISVSSDAGESPSRNRSPRKRRTSVVKAPENVKLRIKQRKVVQEFVDTEKAYTAGLELIHSHFLTPILATLDTPTPLFDRATITAIFSNFIDIWNLHCSFLEALTSSEDKPLSPILQAHFPYLSLYTPFITSFPTTLHTLMNLSPNATTFIREREKDERCGKLQLRDWLLTIVQRCPRYLLLLKDLLAFTDPEDEEYKKLVLVYNLVSKITNSLNTALHTHAQTMSLLSIQRATPNLPIQLIPPGRTLVKRGPLIQMERSEGGKEREFLLFTDCLLWLSRVAGEWVYKGKIELVDLDVILAVEDEKKFDVLSPEGSFVLFAQSVEARDSWCSNIRTTKSQLLGSLHVKHPNSTLASSASTNHLRRALRALPYSPTSSPSSDQRDGVDHWVPAVWIPDERAEACMRCSKRFGWRRRRHHCRLCGRCVCHDCSDRTFFIAPSDSDREGKSARACTACYESVFPVASAPASFSVSKPPPVNETGGTVSSWLPLSIPSLSTPQALMRRRPSQLRPRSLVQVREDMELGIPEEEAPENTVRKHKRFSLPAVALQTTNVTTRSGATVGEEHRGDARHHRLSRRLSLVLSSGGSNGEGAVDTDLARGLAAEKLSDLLGRNSTADTNTS